MGIWLILILAIWMLLAAVLVLAIRAAAARRIPQPVAANVERQDLSVARLQCKHHATIIPLCSVALEVFVLTGCKGIPTKGERTARQDLNTVSASFRPQNHRRSETEAAGALNKKSGGLKS